jgi:hypothetical protein
LNRALAEAAAERVAEALPLQHELIGLPETDRGRQLRERRGGRPPGARNKRLEEAARLVVERFGDPLVHQVAVATMPLDELMAAGLDLKQAMEERRLAAAVVLPYLHQRQAVRVDVNQRQVVHLTIVEGDGEGQQNQEVIEAVVVQSDGGQSDDAAKALALLADPPDAQLIADQAGEAAPPAPVAAPPAPAPREGGGPVFGPGRRSLAPGSVVSRSAGIFRANTPGPTGKGRGT